MSLFDTLRRHLMGEGDAPILDHVPVGGQTVEREERPKSLGEGLSHDEKLKLAATRATEPFKCAADGMPRTVIRDGQDVVVGQPLKPVEPPPKVATITRKVRA